MSNAEGNQARSGPVGGKTEYAQPVFQKIVRQAVASVPGLRLEPLEPGRSLGRFLRRKPSVLARWNRESLELNIDLQVEHGRRIPELASEAQRATTTEIQRLTGYQEVSVNLRVRGLYDPGEGDGR